jgi:hypothetical protein
VPTDTSGWEFQRFESNPAEVREAIEAFVENLDRDTA